jgi:Concanavalin A-like lectin/glucanases superfamily
MPILSSLSVLGAHFSTPPSESPWYADSSSAHHTVTLNGSVTQSDEGDGVKAASFDGTNGSYLNSSTINFGTSPFTIEGFFNPFTHSSGSGLMGLFGEDNGAGNQPKICLYVNANNGNLESYIDVGTSSELGIGVPLANFLTNSWSHVALVRGNGTFNLYINGVLQAIAADDGRDLSGITSPFGVGYFYECSTFNGKIAAFRVVVGSALYTSDFTVPTTLPTAVTGTQLLLNFGATAAPMV